MKDAIMEATGYLAGIGGLLIVLLTFDQPGWAWQAGGALLIVTGVFLIYRYRRRRRGDADDDHGGDSLLDDVVEFIDAD